MLLRNLRNCTRYDIIVDSAIPIDRLNWLQAELRALIIGLPLPITHIDKQPKPTYSRK